MVTVGLLVRLVAKAGKEAEVTPSLRPELLAQPPVIEPVDVLAAKLPE
jgi:hypothetical protein